MNMDAIFIICPSPNKQLADVIPFLFMPINFILIVIVLSLVLISFYFKSILDGFLFIDIVFLFVFKTKIFSHVNSAITKFLTTAQVIFLKRIYI
jgi:hypothetical protein